MGEKVIEGGGIGILAKWIWKILKFFAIVFLIALYFFFFRGS